MDHFTFNTALLDGFDTHFRTPVIFGLFKQSKINESLTFYVISRKDCRRLGRGHIIRGLDDEGNAANFCETEHIFCHSN